MELCNVLEFWKCTIIFKTRTHSSRMHTARSLTYPEVSGGGRSAQMQTLPQADTLGGRRPLESDTTEWHTGVKTLPCRPKLRLRVVIKQISTCQEFCPRERVSASVHAGIHPPPAPRRLLQWTVRMLLEYILVINDNWGKSWLLWAIQ